MLTKGRFKLPKIDPPDNSKPLPRPVDAQTDLPESILYNATKDWRADGSVGMIRDQGICGSCWSFSGTFAIEASHQITNKVLEDFSEQSGADCVTTSFGCRGGYVNHIIKDMIENNMRAINQSI